MVINGNLEVKGIIQQPTLESFDAIDLPAFDAQNKGTLYFNNDLGSITLNDGNTYVTLLTDQSSNETFITTLGDNWINANLSFNPTPFNAMNNVSGLDANSSLFDVLSQFDSAISNISLGSINDLSDVNTSGASNGTILVFDSGSYVVGDINDIASNLQFNFADLQDTTIAGATDNDYVVYDAGTSKFINEKKTFEYENLLGTSSIFNITHNLGVQYCHVSVIDRSTETLVDGPSITYLSTNQLRVETKSIIPVTVLIQAL